MCCCVNAVTKHDRTVFDVMLSVYIIDSQVSLMKNVTVSELSEVWKLRTLMFIYIIKMVIILNIYAGLQSLLNILHRLFPWFRVDVSHTTLLDTI